MVQELKINTHEKILMKAVKENNVCLLCIRQCKGRQGRVKEIQHEVRPVERGLAGVQTTEQNRTVW